MEYVGLGCYGVAFEHVEGLQGSWWFKCCPCCLPRGRIWLISSFMEQVHTTTLEAFKEISVELHPMTPWGLPLWPLTVSLHCQAPEWWDRG